MMSSSTKALLAAAGVCIGLPWIAHELGRRKALAALKELPPYQREVDISVVIPTLNEEKYLPLLLKSLDNQTWRPKEIIVADSRSEDRTVEIAKEWGCKVITTPRGTDLYKDGRDAWAAGVAIARNEGARRAAFDVLLFADADCIFAHDAVELLARKLADSGLTHPRQVYYDEWAFFAVTQTYCGNWFRGWGWPSRVQMVRKKDWAAVGGFPHHYREDVAFAKKIASRYGGKHAVRFVPEAIVGTSARRERRYGVMADWVVHLVR